MAPISKTLINFNGFRVNEDVGEALTTSLNLKNLFSVP
jgi:hypothetical protein